MTFSGLAAGRPASPGSKAPRHGWTGLALEGAKACSNLDLCANPRGKTCWRKQRSELNARQPLDAPRTGPPVFPAEGHMGFGERTRYRGSVRW